MRILLMFLDAEGLYLYKDPLNFTTAKYKYNLPSPTEGFYSFRGFI